MSTQGPIDWNQPGAAPADQGTTTQPPTQADATVPPGYGAPATAPPGYGNPAPAPPAYGGYGGRKLGKIRNPWGVWGLSLITFGIYHLYWWYKINEEVRDFDQSIKVEPVMSLLAIFVPIANLVSLVRTGGRIGQAERNAGSPSPTSGGLGLLLAFLFSMHIIYYQGHLNTLWEQHGGRPEA
ncbi:MAG: DUF4234 domain-containing protein [Aquihabitans sp.]